MIPSATRPAMCRTLGPYPAIQTRGDPWAHVSCVGWPSYSILCPAVSSRNTPTACSNCDQLTGFLPSTRRELSPRPMPSSMRPPEIKFKVANKLAVTVRSRTAGLVTHGPTRMRVVFASMSVIRGYGSFHSTCESKIQPYLNPAPSACRVSATMRSTEISGLSVMPNCMRIPLRSRDVAETEERQFSIEFIVVLVCDGGSDGLRHDHHQRHCSHRGRHLRGRCRHLWQKN